MHLLTPAIREQTIYNQVYGYQNFKQNCKRTPTPIVISLPIGRYTLLRKEKNKTILVTWLIKAT